MNEEHLEKLVEKKVEEKLSEMKGKSQASSQQPSEGMERRDFLKKVSAGLLASGLMFSPALGLRAEENQLEPRESDTISVLGDISASGNDITAENIDVTDLNSDNVTGDHLDVNDIDTESISGNDITLDAGMAAEEVHINEIGSESGDPITVNGVRIEDLDTDSGSGLIPFTDGDGITMSDEIDIVGDIKTESAVDLNENDGKLILPVGEDAGL